MSAEIGSPTVDARLSGVLPVLETPFTPDGGLDAAGFARIARAVADTGASGMMFPGFASEFAKLRVEERRDLAQILIAETRDRPGTVAIVSVPDHATDLAIAEAVWAVEQGADALNLLPPFFLSPSRDAIMDHLARVLEAVPETPVIVQLAPALTGSAFAAQDVVALRGRFPHLTAVKVESVPPGRMVTLFGELDATLPCLVGYAGLYLPDALARGATGVQPGCSFVEIYRDLWSHWENGDHEAFAALHRRLIPFLSTWMLNAELIVQVEKTISMRRGLIASDHCRAPGYRLDEYETASIDRFLSEFADELADL